MKLKFDYKKALRSIRSKITFNYDLRSKLTPGQKGAIRKAVKILNRKRSNRLIVPPKRPKESKSKYSNRIKDLKKKYGQSGTGIKGVFVSIPEFAKYRIDKDGEITFRNANNSRYRERFVPFSNRVIFDDDNIRDSYVRGLIKDQLKSKIKFKNIQIMIGTNRVLGTVSVKESDIIIDLINETIDATDFKYNDIKSAIAGLIFTT